MNTKEALLSQFFLSILEAAFEILIPLCMAEVIDKGVDLGNMSNVWKYGIALLIFAAFQLITGVLSAHIAAKTSVGFSANLRQDMYDNVQTFAFSNIDKFSDGFHRNPSDNGCYKHSKCISDAHSHGSQRTCMLVFSRLYHFVLTVR